MLVELSQRWRAQQILLRAAQGRVARCELRSRLREMSQNLINTLYIKQKVVSFHLGLLSLILWEYTLKGARTSRKVSINISSHWPFSPNSSARPYPTTMLKSRDEELQYAISLTKPDMTCLSLHSAAVSTEPFPVLPTGLRAPQALQGLCYLLTVGPQVEFQLINSLGAQDSS